MTEHFAMGASLPFSKTAPSFLHPSRSINTNDSRETLGIWQHIQAHQQKKVTTKNKKQKKNNHKKKQQNSLRSTIFNSPSIWAQCVLLNILFYLRMISVWLKDLMTRGCLHFAIMGGPFPSQQSPHSFANISFQSQSESHHTNKKRTIWTQTPINHNNKQFSLRISHAWLAVVKVVFHISISHHQQRGNCFTCKTVSLFFILFDNKDEVFERSHPP